MEERNGRFLPNYLPILYQEGHSADVPYDTFNIGKATGSLTTHGLLLPRPKEIRCLTALHAPLDDPERRRATELMLWRERRDRLQGRVDEHFCHLVAKRGAACNSGQLLVPDYLVPGYTGCVHRNPTRTAYIYRQGDMVPTWNSYETVECGRGTSPYQLIEEPCRDVAPFVPSMRLSRGRRECL